MNRNRNTPPNDGSQALDPTRRDALASIGALALIAASLSSVEAAPSTLAGKIAEYRRLAELAADADEREVSLRTAFEDYARKNPRLVPYADGKSVVKIDSIYGHPAEAIEHAARNAVSKVMFGRTVMDPNVTLAEIERILAVEKRDLAACHQATRELEAEAKAFGVVDAETVHDALTDQALVAYEDVLSYRPTTMREVQEYASFLRSEHVISTESTPSQRHIDMIFASLSARPAAQAA